MSTSLAEQLQRLAVPQTAALRRSDKKRASILFDVKEAAGISKETLFQIGCDGFEELKSKNPVFATFEHSLFHLVGKQFERAVQTAEANQKLDKTLKSFFYQLSPYFLMTAAHKALEWLVYRYHIHNYNKDDLILLILPYHDTNIFVRVLQIIEINDNDKWLWLQPLQKPGVHLSKHVLYNHAGSNPGFIQLLSDYVLGAIKEHEKPSYLTVLFNFYCATFTGAVEKSINLNDTHVVQMLPSIIKGLKSDIPDFCASAYIILSKMLTKVTLSKKVLDLLVEKLTEMNVSMLNTEALLVMIVLYQSQENYKTMPDTAVKNLAEKKWLPNLLRELGNTGCLISTVLLPMLGSGIKTGIMEVSTDHGKTLVSNLLGALKLEEEIIHEIFEVITTSYKLKMSYPEKTTIWLKSVVETIEHQYPLSFDKEVGRILKNSTDKQLQYQRKVFERIIENVNMKDQVNFFEKLYHPQDDIRKNAMKNIIKRYTSLKDREQDLLKTVLIDRLNDDNDEVFKETLKITLKSLVNILDMQELKEILVKLLYKHKFDKFSFQIIEKLVQIDGAHDDYEVLIAIFPYIMPCNEVAFRSANFLEQEFIPKCEPLKVLLNLIKNCTSQSDFNTTVLKNLKKIKLDHNLLMDTVTKSPNADDTTFKFTVAILLSKTSTDFSAKMVPIVIDNLKTSSVKFERGDKGFDYLLAIKRLPLAGYLNCIDDLIKKCPKQALHIYDFYQDGDFTNACISMFNFLLEGAFAPKTSHAEIYAKSLNVFLKYFALNNEVEFLLNYVTCDNRQATLGNKLRSLKSAHALLQTKKSFVSVTSESYVVSYLLVCLHSEHQIIRNISLQCLSRIVNLTKYYKQLVLMVLDRTEDILQDGEQLPYAIGCGDEEMLTNVLNLVALLNENVPIYLKSGIVAACGRIDNLELYKTILEYTMTIATTKNTQTRKIVTDCIEQFTTLMAKSTTVSSVLWIFITAMLKDDQSSLETISPAIMLLNKIDKQMFSAFTPAVQMKLLDLIIEMTTNSTNPEMLPAATKVFKHIDLDALAILDLLHNMRDVVSPKLQTKMRRRISVVPTLDILDTSEWRKATTVLEFIQDKKKMRNIDKLIPVLFDILKKCLDFDEQASVEYPKQLVLSSILHYCDKIDPTILPQNIFNMELVVQCIRASPNPQTHHHALLLLAKVASFIPNQVLLHIMAIFTFMGSSVLRHDDAYSFQIIAKIIDTIIPILVKERSKNDIVSVLRVFVDVILDVPEHRRMPLYSQLLEQIGPKENLYIFALLIFEAHVFNKTKEGTKRLDIAKSLCLEFSPEVIILTSIQLIDFVKSLPVDKEDYKEGDFLFDVKNNTPKQFRHFKYTLVLFASNLLASKELVNQVAKLSDDENEHLEEHYKKLIVNILTYIQSTSKVAENNANTPQAQYWKVMLHHTYDLLDSLNALLTAQMFLLVVKGLMTHQLNTVKRRALELLNSKLQVNPEFFSDCEQRDLYAMIPPLILIIKEVEKDSLDSDEEVIIQTALLSLKLFVRLLAAENPEKFVQILYFITELIKSNIDANILASAILCLAELCTHLRSHSISSLPKFMPAIIKVLKTQNKEEYPTLLLLSSVTTLQKILDVLSLFISPYLEKLLCEICNLTSKWQDADDSKTGPFVTKMKNIREKLGSSIPSRVLIPSVDASYKILNTKAKYNSIGPLMEILSESLTHLKGAEIQQDLPELTTFFLYALEFRATAKSSETIKDDVIKQVETCVIKAVTNLVLKLSESSFRPFYYKLYDWAIRSEGKNEKIITFYSFSYGVANSLKGLFVLFAGHFINNAATVLESCNTKNQPLYFEEEHKNIELLENILKTLNLVFMYDSHKFVNKERFDILMQPVVDQLDNTLGNYEARVRDIVIPTVVNFTVATGDDSLWKQLNYQILLKMRDGNPKIRMLALECLRDVCKKVGEDFLPLLPETIPFLAELLEDEEEDIEKACQKTIQELEKVLGEPLGKYF